MIKIEKEFIKEIIDKALTLEQRRPLMFFQTKNNDIVENYLKRYSNKHGYYLVTLDEFTMEYIDEVAELYRKLSDNDYCIIHIKMLDYIDYSTLEYQLALHKLSQIILDPEYNIQIIIDVKLPSNPNALKDTGSKFENIYNITHPVSMPLILLQQCAVLGIV